MRHKIYNPATSGPQIQARPQVHDRRAREINRGSAGHIVETEVNDPYELGAKISAVRSVRDDPLADHHACGHIDARGEALLIVWRHHSCDAPVT